MKWDCKRNKNRIKKREKKGKKTGNENGTRISQESGTTKKQEPYIYYEKQELNRKGNERESISDTRKNSYKKVVK
jgi:hypothetical protein